MLEFTEPASMSPGALGLWIFCVACPPPPTHTLGTTGFHHPVKVASIVQQVTFREGTVVNAVLSPCLGHKLARYGGVTPGPRPQHASHWCYKEAKTCSASAEVQIASIADRCWVTCEQGLPPWTLTTWIGSGGTY